MTRKALAALAFAMFLPNLAAAQNWSEGVYVEVRGGASFLTDSDLDDLGGFTDIELETDTGWLVDGAVGYAHDSGLRGEIALGYRENEFDELSADFGGSSFSGNVDGDIAAFTAMANGYYDFYLGKYGAEGAAANLAPFLGAGIGVALFDIDGDLGDEKETAFAYQLTAGLAYAFTPNIGASLSYAFFSAPNAKFEGTEFDYDSHNVMAGIRYTF